MISVTLIWLGVYEVYKSYVLPLSHIRDFTISFYILHGACKINNLNLSRNYIDKTVSLEHLFPIYGM